MCPLRSIRLALTMPSVGELGGQIPGSRRCGEPDAVVRAPDDRCVDQEFKRRELGVWLRGTLIGVDAVEDAMAALGVAAAGQTDSTLFKSQKLCSLTRQTIVDWRTPIRWDASIADSSFRQSLRSARNAASASPRSVAVAAARARPISHFARNAGKNRVRRRSLSRRRNPSGPFGSPLRPYLPPRARPTGVP